jgi:hypothetical protein
MSMVRTNPHLSDVCLHIGWKELEKEPGHLDFSAIDKTVAVVRRIGRKYELGIKAGVAACAQCLAVSAAARKNYALWS